MRLKQHLLLMAVCLVILMLALSGCALMGAKVRYDAAPSPVDNNQHTVLMEVECGDGITRAGYGQVGCSYEANQKNLGTVRLHTPLPGAISMVSRTCGVDQTDFHNDKGGSFRYDLSPLLPDGVTACVIDVFVSWQLPPKLTSEYPLRGMLGKIYLRRRQAGSAPAPMVWSNGKNALGVGWNQFREVARPVVAGEPLALELRSTTPVVSGKYRLFGCGQGVADGSFSGNTISITRDQLLGAAPKQGGCLMFGYVVGRGPNGETITEDVAVGVEVFGAKVLKVAAQVRVENGQVCYDAEDAVSLGVLNYDSTNQGSNDVSHCFKLPEGVSSARLGLFTHQGRALYALIENGQLSEVMQ